MAKQKPLVVVIASGGVITDVLFSDNLDVELVVIDYDEAEGGSKAAQYDQAEDLIVKAVKAKVLVSNNDWGGPITAATALQKRL